MLIHKPSYSGYVVNCSGAQSLIQLIYMINQKDDISWSAYPDIVSVQQAQEALKIGRVAVYNLIQSSCLNAFRIGRIYKISKHSLMQYISEVREGA